MDNYKGKACKECGEIILVFSGSGFCRKCWHKKRGGALFSSIEETLKRHSKNTTKYHQLTVDGQRIREHRYVWEHINGKLPEGWIIHHLNGLKGDNRIENLIALPRSSHDTKALITALQKRIRELESQGGLQ